MEPTSITAVTLASILSSLSASDAPVSKSVISTHISPAIAGQWEIELDNAAAFSDAASAMIGAAEPQASLSSLRDTQSLEYGVIERDKVAANESLLQAQTSTINSDLQSTAQKVCRERYNFGADNNVWAVSGDEWTYGKYLVTHPEQGLPIIAIKTIYDNNEVDCSGNQIDQTGEAIVAYLNHQGNQMQWCADTEGEECFMTFHRILP